MSHFPAVTAKEVIKVLQKAGFYEHHQKGSPQKNFEVSFVGC
jgi:predicted RNA binding protein YcfA (HicA-like mRNA interferase family)